MTPSEVTDVIRQEYLILKERADKKEINESCIYGIIRNRCREGTQHNGIPNCWLEYMPEELLGKV